MPGLAGQFLDRVHERQAARVGQEADRVAMRAAAEAMVEALFVVDREAGRLLLWNGQQALNSRPALMSFTDGAMTADRVVRARSSSSQAGERVI